MIFKVFKKSKNRQVIELQQGQLVKNQQLPNKISSSADRNQKSTNQR
jgi:hypothetical protein